MAISQVPPLSSNVPIVYPPGHPSAGCPTPAFATLMQILLDEKAITDALAAGAIQPGTVTTSGLTAAAQRILGNKEATTGAIEELTVTEALDLIAGTAAQGDIFYRGATSVKRLAAGTSGQFLKTLGAGADPAWAAVSGGGGGLAPIASTTLAAAASQVVFSSIPATYRDLVIVAQARSDLSGIADIMRCQLSGDTGSNYSYERSNRFGTATGGPVAYIEAASLAASTATANVGDTVTIEIANYAGSVFHKMLRAFSDTVGTGNPFYQITTGRWASTAAVNQVRLFSPANNFVIGSTFAIYGRG